LDDRCTSFSENVKTELTEELRIQELHANLKKAEQTNMENLSPEVAESVKSLREAAKMVDEPYKVASVSQSDGSINKDDSSTENNQ